MPRQRMVNPLLFQEAARASVCKGSKVKLLKQIPETSTRKTSGPVNHSWAKRANQMLQI